MNYNILIEWGLCKNYCVVCFRTKLIKIWDLANLLYLLLSINAESKTIDSKSRRIRIEILLELRLFVKSIVTFACDWEQKSMKLIVWNSRLYITCYANVDHDYSLFYLYDNSWKTWLWTYLWINLWTGLWAGSYYPIGGKWLK